LSNDFPVVLVTLIFWVASLYLILYILPRHWSGRAQDREMNFFHGVPYSPEFRKGLQRLIPSIAAVSTAFSWGLTGLTIERIWENRSTWVLFAYYLPAGIALLVFPFLGYFIVYRSVPKVLIAPGHRGDIGVTQYRRNSGTLRKTRIRAVLLWSIFAGAIAVTIVVGISNRLHNCRLSPSSMAALRP
jgi:hypothetical protein